MCLNAIYAQAKPPNGSNTGIRPPWRVFLVSGNRELIQKVKEYVNKQSAHN